MSTFKLTFRKKNDPVIIAGKIAAASKAYAMGTGWGAFAALSDIVALGVQFAPEVTGTLKHSGYATIPKRGTGDIVLEGGFGGPADSYVGLVNRRTRFFTKAIDELGNGERVAKLATIEFVKSGAKPKARVARTPHNARSRAAQASKGGK